MAVEMQLVGNTQKLVLPSRVVVFDKLQTKHPTKNAEVGVGDARVE